MTSFRSITLASLLIAVNANEETPYVDLCSAVPPVTCNVDTPLDVASYDVLNGSEDNYRDEYTGGPFTKRVFLSDGLGDLTDGAIASNSYNVGGSFPATALPYVGWLRGQFPSSRNEIPISFKFTKDETVSKVEISVDDPLPASSGGITAPASVIIHGHEYTFPPNTTPQSGPYTAEIELIAPVYVQAGGSLEIKLVPVDSATRPCRPNGTGGQCVWVFASEVQFFQPCSETLSACIEQERAKCCYKTDSGCGRRELQENDTLKAKEDSPGVRKLFTSCFWGDDVFTKKSTDLCLEECFAYGERMCFIDEEFGLLQECDDSWWSYDGHMP